MAKGIAVVSGSNDVVFKALETGIITAGSGITYARVGVTGSFSVSGSTGAPTLFVDEDSVSIVGALDFTGDLQVTGNVYVSQDVSASQDLKSGRDAIIGRNLDVEGQSDLKGNLTVEEGNLVVQTGTTTLADKLTVQSGGAEVTGNLNLQGEISASSHLNVGGNLDVEGQSDLKGKLTVEVGGADITGDADFRDNVVIHGNLEVKGDTTVTTDNLKNMTVEDAITQFGIGADAATQDIGFVFGDSNSRALIVDDGVFKLGTTSDDASGAAVTVADDGILVLGQITASVGILAKDVHIQDTLTVEDDVTLGQDSNDTVTVNGVLTASANVVLEEDVVMGTDSDDFIKVVGQIRMPIFTVAEGHPNHVSGYPVVPADYLDNKAAYNGHMFYLTSSDDTNWTASGSLLQGNKWYFNERGDWHASFLFSE